MMKRSLLVLLAGVMLAGCINDSALSGDVYSASQARQAHRVTYGTIISVRPVKIQGGGDSNALGGIGGAVLGGLLGNTVGGGAGKKLATAAGAIAGGMAGQGVQGAINRTNGVELEIQLDSGGSPISVTQKAGPTQFSVGQKVRVVVDRQGMTTVSPR